MKKYTAKVSAICLLFLIAIFWTATLTYNVRAVPRAPRNPIRTVTMDSLLNPATDDMFTVTGGRIEIVSLFGECTTSIGTVGTTDIYLDATAGAAYDRDFCTAVNIDALVAGGIVTFTNAVSEGVLTFATKEGAGQTLSWFCSPGVIILDPTTAGSTGAITWYMSYRRLENASRVTPN